MVNHGGAGQYRLGTKSKRGILNLDPSYSLARSNQGYEIVNRIEISRDSESRLDLYADLELYHSPVLPHRPRVTRSFSQGRIAIKPLGCC